MGGVIGKGGVIAYIVAFEPRQNVSYKCNDVGCNPSFSCDPTHSYVPFFIRRIFY